MLTAFLSLRQLFIEIFHQLSQVGRKISLKISLQILDTQVHSRVHSRVHSKIGISALPEPRAELKKIGSY
jgi:hypothetical protein